MARHVDITTTTTTTKTTTTTTTKMTSSLSAVTTLEPSWVTTTTTLWSRDRVDGSHWEGGPRFDFDPLVRPKTFYRILNGCSRITL